MIFTQKAGRKGSGGQPRADGCNRKGGFFSGLGMWVRAMPSSLMQGCSGSDHRPGIGRLKKEPVDAIISTGPPHSMHRIALQVRRATGIPWIADFRDPWTNNDVYHRLPLRKGQNASINMEKEVYEPTTGWSLSAGNGLRI